MKPAAVMRSNEQELNKQSALSNQELLLEMMVEFSEVNLGKERNTIKCPEPKEAR